MTQKKAIIVTAHTDDECFCAGLIQNLHEKKYDIHIACMSPAIESIPPEFAKTDTENEFYTNCQYNLLFKYVNILLFEYPVRYFYEHQQDITERLYKINQKIQPDIVVFPSLNDCHQDHNIVARACQRIFKNCTQYGIEFPHNNYDFVPRLYVSLSDEQMQVKLKCVSTYKSQMAKQKDDYLVTIENYAKFRGSQINKKYAECFEIYRKIV